MPSILAFQSASSIKRHTPVNHVNISDCRSFYQNIDEVSIDAYKFKHFKFITSVGL